MKKLELKKMLKKELILKALKLIMSKAFSYFLSKLALVIVFYFALLGGNSSGFTITEFIEMNKMSNLFFTSYGSYQEFFVRSSMIISSNIILILDFIEVVKKLIKRKQMR